MPLNWTLNNGQDGKFCYVYFTTIKKNFFKRGKGAICAPHLFPSGVGGGY